MHCRGFHEIRSAMLTKPATKRGHPMRKVVKLAALAAAFGLLGGTGSAWAQPAGPGPGMGMGMGPGMMGGGGRGVGLGLMADPESYLAGLKSELGITATQEPAWDAYAEAVKTSAEQMRGAHQTMYEAMGTATWQERQDMMNRMFETRQEAYTRVHTAAQKLLPALTPTQRSKAMALLPGLRARARGMMGRMGPPRSSP